jgi:3-methyladenine DNA glycosylase AlkD
MSSALAAAADSERAPGMQAYIFIRKAIGWALRSYAWTDPDEVARYVAANEARLSSLSRREALKNIR